MLSRSSIGKALLETFLNSCSGVASGLERCAIFVVDLLLILARTEVEISSSEMPCAQGCNFTLMYFKAHKSSRISPVVILFIYLKSFVISMGIPPYHLPLIFYNPT